MGHLLQLPAWAQEVGFQPEVLPPTHLFPEAGTVQVLQWLLGPYGACSPPGEWLGCPHGPEMLKGLVPLCLSSLAPSIHRPPAW